ncbi:MAG: hypothetical protein NUW23_01825, partial [Firmicutes bacterium]|nr:hypothetical protein [Bacillota bacterium]
MEHDANAKTGGSDTQSQSTQAAGALGWRPDAGEPTEGSVGLRDVCKETDELVDAHPLRIAEAQNQRTVKSCRFCWMCRHLCTVGNQTWLESTTPRGRALNLYSVLKGAGKFDSEVADVIYKC